MLAEVTFAQVYPLACKITAVRSASFVVAAGLSSYYRIDIQQEMLLDLWRTLPRFDPGRASWQTFAERVAANRLASLRRSLYSGRYGYRKEEPLA